MRLEMQCVCVRVQFVDIWMMQLGTRCLSTARARQKKNCWLKFLVCCCGPVRTSTLQATLIVSMREGVIRQINKRSLDIEKNFFRAWLREASLPHALLRQMEVDGTVEAHVNLAGTRYAAVTPCASSLVLVWRRHMHWSKLTAFRRWASQLSQPNLDNRERELVMLVHSLTNQCGRLARVKQSYSLPIKEYQ